MLLLLLLLLAAVVVAAARIDIAAAAAAGGVYVRLLSAVSFAAVGGANCGCFFYLTRLPRV